MFGLINPPTTNISNELTDKATKSLTAPKEESTSGGGQSIGCSDDTVACWAEKWGNTGNSVSIPPLPDSDRADDPD